MRYLLDTDICIAIIKNSEKVLRRLNRCAVGDVVVSAISVAELQFGISKSSAILKNELALKKFLSNFPICEFNQTDAQSYGPIRARLQSSGTPIGALDTLIAAQAVARNLVLVTNNTKEFERVRELTEIENWLS